jgi:transcriptional regulator with XRE-family HTH domain
MPRKSIEKDKITKIIGKRVMNLRESKEMTRIVFAEIMDVTQQQVQKYEIGKNRVPCESLYLLANYFELSINYFFDHVEG